MDPERAAGDLDPVHDQVVRHRPRLARVGVDQLERLVGRPRERVVHGRPALLVLVPLEQREVGHPEEPPGFAVDQLELAAEVQPQRAEHARDHGRLVGAEEHGRGRLGPERRQLLLGEELRNRRAHLALLVEHEVRETFRPPFLGERLQPVELCARELLRDAQVAHRRRVREDAELRPARQLGRVVDLEPEAEVGLVGAVAELCLVPGHALEGRLDLDVEALAPDPQHRPFHQREQLLAVREGHLDVELRQLLQPVGAQILVPEAARDLEVALEPGDHEQLLVGLRRLRQREEAAWLESRRDDEVARALGSLLGQDRRLDVDEPGRLHLRPDDRDRSGARADVPLHLRAPQIEPAVADPQRLVDVLLVELERQRLGARDDLERVHLQLDLAGRQVRVDRVRRAGDDLALGPEHELVADLVRRLRRLRGALGVDHAAARGRSRRGGRRTRARRGRAAAQPSPRGRSAGRRAPCAARPP